MQRYAQIDQNGICFAIIESKGNLDNETMIKLHPHKDENVIGRKYVDGTWVEVETPNFPNTNVSIDKHLHACLQFLLGKYCTATYEQMLVFFQQGFWSKAMLSQMVQYGVLSEEQYQSVTNEPYRKE